MLALVTAMIILGSGATVAAADPPEPAPVDDLSRFESATVVSGLSVVVERDGDRLVAKQDTSYTIGVSNRGKQAQTVRVRVTVPPWMSEASPHDGGELGSGFVEWPVTLAPGQVTVLRMTGAYASPGRDTPTRVAFTACALGAEDNQPIVCATDIAKLEPASSGRRWWLVALGVIVVAAALAGGLRWRRGWRRPAPAEPASDAPPVPAS